ncbi:Transcriptional regulator MraZ [Poriferisphaera corsica]|uniref:Transcriptional regulator MraZ n=1 Tax=Poriferisphaera corsica TaxID=2528020 RepID=A0A517YYT5_9BACT|nr:hypothetical protein [Poriferisphaera corsica]QDU35376.1 Transcriptional regulator MraZ [Poriferisphaera corsica]
MVFTGTYEHSIDAKNRLAIPAPIRAQIQRAAGAGEGDAIALFVIPGELDPEGGSLSIYTESDFEKRAQQLDDSELDADQLLEYERILFSLATRVEIDKQGRVRLPESLIKRANLPSDIVLLGVKDHLEVHSREAWLKRLEERLAQNPALLTNPRRMMRR